MNKQKTQLGYIQRGNRYFIRRGASTSYTSGFKSKEDFNNWFEEERQVRDLDWRAGFSFKWSNEETFWEVVDKKGVRLL